MALPGGTIWEVENGGSDTNGGGFNPTNANMATDLKATSGTTTAPVVSSASYMFASGDVGAWIFIQAGTNWIPGWYQIASVLTGSATLTATIGSGVLWNATKAAATGMSTAAGCVNGSYVSGTASGTWTIDYSQQSSALSLTGLTTGGATAIILSLMATKATVGNTINITGGTNFLTGWYSITSVVASTSMTVDRTCASAAATSGTANLGGAFATPGGAAVPGQPAASITMVKYNASDYVATSATTNIAAGCVAPVAESIWCGYNTSRFVGNKDALRPTFQINTAVSAATLFNNAINANVLNFILDGNNNTTSRGVSVNGKTYNCLGENFTNTAFFDNGGSGRAMAINCRATTCSTQPAFGIGAYFCQADANTVSGFGTTASYYWFHCLSFGNTGSTSDGFDITGNSQAVNCTAYGNGKHGFLATANNSNINLINCIAEGNAGFGFTAGGGSSDPLTLTNCADYNNTSGRVGSGSAGSPVFDINPISQSAGSYFVNAASSNFALNSTVGQGALVRAAAYPSTSPDGLTANYMDVGAAQHQDSGGGGGSGGAPVLQSAIIQGLGAIG